jgi:hypothetical protein
MINITPKYEQFCQYIWSVTQHAPSLNILITFENKMQKVIFLCILKHNIIKK